LERSSDRKDGGEKLGWHLPSLNIESKEEEEEDVFSLLREGLEMV
jgi:hypothetical protein